VTSLRQAAAVGAVAVGELVNRLRAAAGLDATRVEADQPATQARPVWVDAAAPAAVEDVRAAIDAGEMPLPRVMEALEALPAGAVLVLVTPFPPAPISERLRAAGYETWTERRGPQEVHTHCRRPESAES
jgi:hypothetical protein